MQVYQAVKSGKLADLNVDASALYLIAAPKTPESVRREAIARAQSGERMNHAKVVELQEQLKKRAGIAIAILAETIEDCKKDMALAKAQNDLGAITSAIVSLVIAFWQAIEILRHPYLSFETAAQIAFLEHPSVAQVWDNICGFNPTGMDICDQVDAALANLTKVAERIRPCEDAQCLSKAEPQRAQADGNPRDGAAS
jgi:hypothetical protein